ncbi:MAG: hypothetical protein H7Z41_07030 [Cytophagales bacterium]|nr:hypothetical protein [Armatimonadota bacterium]
MIPLISKTVLRRVGGQVAAQAVGEQRKPGNLLDFKLGVSLLRDRRVPAATKLLALSIGVGLTFALEAFEMPLEAFVALVLPGVGLAANFAMDGIEAILCPLIFAALAVPHLAPQTVAAEARAVRRGLPNPQPSPLQASGPSRRR